MRRLIFARTRAEPEAGTGTPARASGRWPRRGWFVVLGVYLLVYISSLVWRWIPVDQSLVGQAAMSPLALVAAVLAWPASQRVRGSRRTALAWRLVSLALLGQFAGGIAAATYHLLGRSPYPSLADPL